MKTIAIKGHSTRGHEVIEILEMLGGKNIHNSWGVFESRIYTIDEKTDEIIDVSERHYSDYNLFTIEEFLEKFPYKVGDKVIVTGLPEYPKNIIFMEWFDGNIYYSFDNETWFLPSELKPYEKETVEENLTIQDIRDNNAEWLLNKLEGMSSESALQTINDLYCELHKPQYPKTYEECCKVLFPNSIELGKVLTSGYNCELLKKLGELLICRNAYWKIVGEQMGLGEPWKPNWLNTEQDKFVLYTNNNVICSNRFVLGHNVLAFPTAEMRDVFYENFKELIEKCKELL